MYYYFLLDKQDNISGHRRYEELRRLKKNMNARLIVLSRGQHV